MGLINWFDVSEGEIITMKVNLLKTILKRTSEQKGIKEKL